jgi:hypothetical protein
MTVREQDLAAPLIRPADSLRVQVGRALRTAVITGEMVPDVVYSVPALAELYGVRPPQSARPFSTWWATESSTPCETRVFVSLR